MGVMIIALLWAITQKKIALAGFIRSRVHFKIYPFIYAPSIFWCWTMNISVTQPSTKSWRKQESGHDRQGLPQ